MDESDGNVLLAGQRPAVANWAFPSVRPRRWTAELLLPELKNIAGLAVQHLANGLEGAETNGFGFPGF